MIHISDVFGELTCFRCISNGYHDCVIKPPPAEPCSKYFQRKGHMNCIIAKISITSGSCSFFYFTNIFILCTLPSHIHILLSCSGCINQSDKISLCYNICSTNNNNCNKANIFRSSLIMYLVLSYCMTL